MEILLANPWQTVLVVLAIALAIKIILGESDVFFDFILSLIKILIDEILFRSSARRGATINFVMLIFAVIVAALIIFHESLTFLNIELETSQVSNSVVAAGLFLAVSLLSTVFVYHFDKERNAFTDD